MGLRFFQVRFANLAVASLVAVSACADKANPPDFAPTNVAVQPGDGVALMTWETLPDLVYWIFYQPGDAVNAAQVGSIAIKNAVSPHPVTGLVNGTEYAFVMNVTQQDSAAGPSSPVVTTIPRLAGSFWTVGGAPIAPSNLNALAFNGATRYVAVGDATTILAGDFNYRGQNPLGVSQWDPPNIPFSNPLNASFSDDLKAVIYNGSFVVLGSHGAVANSPDGVNWTVQHQVFPGVTGLNGLAFGGNGMYFAVGNGGQLYTATDLTQQWTNSSPSIGTSSDLTSASVLNGFLVVTGANNTLFVTPDGVNWTPQATGLPSGTTLRSATFMPNVLSGNPAYVVVGDGGAITSTAAILKDSTGTIATGTWAPTPVPGGQSFRSVTVGGALTTRFLAVGDGGAVAFADNDTSQVQLQWNTASSGADLSSVHFFTGQYLAVGAGGVGAVSH